MGTVHLRGRFPVPKVLVNFVFGRFVFGNIVARSALHAEPTSKAVDAWRSRLSGRGVDYRGVDFCPSQASGVDFEGRNDFKILKR